MLRPEVAVAGTALVAVIAMMLAELKRSRSNERSLRQQGAVEPPDDVYRAMAVVYPGIFVVMAVEGALTGPTPDRLLIAGFAIFVAAKVLKLWAITALGPRWCYRVLVLPGAPLVSTGPYAFLSHPNYAAVRGEIAGFALMVSAPITGIISLAVFALLLRRRIAVEEKALRYT